VGTSRLQLYNEALRMVGDRRLSTLTENRTPRFLLDDVWDADFVNRILEAAIWTFAIRMTRQEPSPEIEPTYGYRLAYEYPDDLRRVAGVWIDEFMRVPQERYATERRIIYQDLQPLYLSYVSSHEQYGGDLSLWTGAVTDYAGAYMASEIAPHLTHLSAPEREGLQKETKRLFKAAAALDAMEQPAKHFPMGQWAQARRGYQKRFQWSTR
jgi:hypothetical protein